MQAAMQKKLVTKCYKMRQSARQIERQIIDQIGQQIDALTLQWK